MLKSEEENSLVISLSYVDDSSSWKTLNLDPCLMQAVDNLGFQRPTLIQSNAIPLAIEERRDIIAQSATGSGKTAAYLLPIIQNLLVNPSDKREIRSLILVPTRELSSQVSEALEKLLVHCNIKIDSVNISSGLSEQVINSLMFNRPHVIIATPAKLINVLEKNASSNTIDLSTVQTLVIDEVDLVLSYGYMDDLRKLETFLPIKKNLQTFLMSATINDDVNELKERFCTKAAVLKVNEENIVQNNLVQFYTKTTEFDKFLLAYVIFKLALVKGKTLIFVNTIDRGYRLKLYLEQFGIRACVLNSELPVNSRLHIVEEFNKNVYQLLIATDETNDFSLEEDGEVQDEDEDSEKKSEEKSVEKLNSKDKNAKSKKSKRQHRDKEYGVSRGIDFHNVSCVLNFDLPLSSKSYIHRVGRTARAGKPGMALSFVVPKKEVGKHKTASLPTSKKDEKVLNRIVKQQLRNGFEIKPYNFDMKQVEGFRYRAEDAFRAVTLVSVKDARVKDLKNELLNSEKLKRYFQENPKDLASLRHDKELHPTRVQSHLKRVPEYLLPESARSSIRSIGFIPFHKNRIRKKKPSGRTGRKLNPLKSFKI